MADSTDPVRSPILEKALTEHGGNNREIAEEAGVSFRSLAEARNGIDGNQLKSSRKQHGVAESMTRLSIYLDVDPEQVLREIGIDPTDPTIRRHMERARIEATPKERTQDSVLHSMRARAGDGRPGPIVGMVPWLPLFNGDLAGPSVGLALARSLLRSLDPCWGGPKNLAACESFVDAETQVLSQELGTPEIAMGLYDLPWRRSRGVDVVTLPGLSVRLGGLCTRQIGWRDILLAEHGEKPPWALVINGDAGSKLLSGAVLYPRLLDPPLTSFDVEEAADRIRREVLKKPKDPSGFLFVADGPFVSQVANFLPDLVEVKPLFPIIDKRDTAPSYKFGVGVPVDAERFRFLIGEAISKDLLGRVFPKLVDLYLRLLGADRDGHVRLDISELDGDRGARFLELALEGVDDGDRSDSVFRLKKAGVPEEELIRAGVSKPDLKRAEMLEKGEAL